MLVGGGGKKGGVTWSNADTVFLSPFEDLIDKNKQNFYGGVPEDIFFAGYVNIPENAIFLNREKGETRKEFRKRVEDTINEMGYRVLQSGFGDSDLRVKFREAMEKRGYDGSTIHSHTTFSESEIPLRNMVFDGSDKVLNNKGIGGHLDHIRAQYIQEIGNKTGVDPSRFLKRHKATYRDLDRFYQYIQEKSQKAPRFEEWLREETDKEDSRYSLGTEMRDRGINSRFVRNFFGKIFEDKERDYMQSKEQSAYNNKRELARKEREYNSWKKKVKKAYKEHLEDFPIRDNTNGLIFEQGRNYQRFGELNKQGKRLGYDLRYLHRDRERDLANAKKEKDKYAQGYSPAIKNWEEYWNNRLGEPTAEKQNKSA